MSLKQTILHEVHKTALATAFFLVGFNLLALLLVTLAPGPNAPLSLFAAATLAALVVGKIMVVADALLNRILQRRGTLIVSVVKKAAALTVVVLLALTVEALIHGMRAEGLTLGESWHHLAEQAPILLATPRARSGTIW